MERIAISDLSEPVRTLLEKVTPGKGIVVEDEEGRARYGIVPYVEASPAEQAAAWETIERLQKKSRKAMDEAGVTDAEVEAEILKDD